MDFHSQSRLFKTVQCAYKQLESRKSIQTRLGRSLILRFHNPKSNAHAFAKQFQIVSLVVFSFVGILYLCFFFFFNFSTVFNSLYALIFCCCFFLYSFAFISSKILEISNSRNPAKLFVECKLKESFCLIIFNQKCSNYAPGSRKLIHFVWIFQ